MCMKVQKVKKRFEVKAKSLDHYESNLNQVQYTRSLDIFEQGK